jgi:hypothetical protein
MAGLIDGWVWSPGARLMQLRMFYLPDEPADAE